MSPDEAVDAVMRGPFECDGITLDPPSPAVEAAMRSFLRALVEARPSIEYDVGYDVMEGLTVEFHAASIDALVSVIMWNQSTHAHVCGPTGPARLPAVGAVFAESASLVPEALRRVDIAALREAAK